ncbi:DNA-binding response regulator [Enterococcus faecalis]|uniref:response regulator transcription factor n=1 Tax=Enterococcus faecalis TaxID=1351 RepID=UPI0009C0A831|nr:response regulator transcription factor [Enterococcus faecalis]EKZ0165069.1 response regulator transcription factor [Enterococcus faecalis]ELT8947895.1 response regulator transcription factor [Enterococcus faecalis]OQO72628.1 DNA-binding response regulator [Enterococcus faecalis]
MFTILLCEDELLMRKILCKILINEGYKVIESMNGEEALRQFYQSKIDLVVLDWMMPKLSGIEVVKQIKAERNVPIIMLTAKNLPEDEIVALLTGVDDYLAKPFHAQVLLTRIAKLLGIVNQVVKERLLLIPKENSAIVDGTKLRLTRKEYDLLYYLYQNKGQVVTREQLLLSVWGMETEKDERTVDSFIRLLRDKLGKEFIKTVYGMGYQFGIPEK